MIKILGNIINNPTQTQSYGDLNFKKLNVKLSKCKPALGLLVLCGFSKSQNNRRLIWRNTKNNIKILKHIHDTLITMKLPIEITGNNISNKTNNNQQPKQEDTSLKPLSDNQLSVQLIHSFPSYSSTNYLKQNSQQKGYDYCFGKDAEESQVIIANCQHLSRMFVAMKYVQSLHDYVEDESTRNVALEMYFIEEYKGCLDDYIHIISTHSNHLQYIYQQLSKCPLSKCKMAKRCNHNDRRRDELLHNIKENSKVKFYSDLIDAIHFWLYHQFDVGMRVEIHQTDEKGDTDFINADEDKQTEYIDSEFARMKRKIFQQRDKWKTKQSNQSNRVEKYTMKVDDNIVFNDFDGDDNTYIDSICKHLREEGISRSTIQSFEKYLMDEKYDTDAVIADIFDHENGSNIIEFSRHTLFQSFFKALCIDLNGMLITDFFTYIACKLLTIK